MKKNALYIVLILVVAGCGPAGKLRRAQKLIAKAEAQGAVWHSDTVYRTIEIPIPEVKHDTTFISEPGDTIRIEKERLQIKYVKLPGDSVFIQGECLPDTIKIVEPVTVTRTIVAPKAKGIKWWWLVIAVVATGLIVKLFGK